MAIIFEDPTIKEAKDFELLLKKIKKENPKRYRSLIKLKLQISVEFQNVFSRGVSR